MKEFQMEIIRIYTGEMSTGVTSLTSVRYLPHSPEQGCVCAQDWYQISLMIGNKFIGMINVSLDLQASCQHLHMSTRVRVQIDLFLSRHVSVPIGLVTNFFDDR